MKTSFFNCELVNFVNFPCCFSFVLHGAEENRDACKTNRESGTEVNEVHKFTLNKTGIYAVFLAFFSRKGGARGGWPHLSVNIMNIC